MKYRKFGKENFETSLLGFGTMRFPTINGKNLEIYEEIKRLNFDCIDVYTLHNLTCCASK
ncbi:hypothetical protein [Maledivibacter halophilus]|uniref:Aldo/keto reductase family protein n=1 Tax=Maledivibacter halophilus TaxID=36842 RepID=A0A1T5M7H5_9FIRM|nr:hypothetical protein [Maledivibacter halophilus]SKC84190.1 hypothetical protein SAMN02194393_04029 [Maledivibacter halophilus]